MTNCGNENTTNKKKKENFEISPCYKNSIKNFDQCYEMEKGSCFKKGLMSYNECVKNGYNFIYFEPGYRQATKCPCPFERKSFHPYIPFI